MRESQRLAEACAARIFWLGFRLKGPSCPIGPGESGEGGGAVQNAEAV